jgi:hypothetical protein
MTEDGKKVSRVRFQVPAVKRSCLRTKNRRQAGEEVRASKMTS